MTIKRKLQNGEKFSQHWVLIEKDQFDAEEWSFIPNDILNPKIN